MMNKTQTKIPLDIQEKVDRWIETGVIAVREANATTMQQASCELLQWPYNVVYHRFLEIDWLPGHHHDQVICFRLFHEAHLRNLGRDSH